MLAQPSKHKFTVSEYLSLFAHKVLAESSRTELFDGEIIGFSPLGFKHAKAQQLLSAFLGRIFNPSDVFTTGSIIVDEFNMPESDVFVTKPNSKIDDYPRIEQLMLVVEVADSTINSDLTNDGTGKLSLYAKGFVPQVLVIDINARIIHKFSSPTDKTFAQTESFSDEITLEGVTEKVDHLIP